MAIAFSADEVFQIAEQIERNGVSFYHRAAEIVPEQQTLFGELADMEVTHEKTFAGMRAKLATAEQGIDFHLHDLY